MKGKCSYTGYFLLAPALAICIYLDKTSGMESTKLVQRTANRFIKVFREIQATYTAYPYFTSPEQKLENNLAIIMSLKEHHNLSPKDIDAILFAIDDSISFIKDRIPPTAIDKALYIDRLNCVCIPLREYVSTLVLCPIA